MRGRRAAMGVVALSLTLAACTSQPPDPERLRTVVVAVDAAFGSLNAGLADGRTPGSTLVRGLVQDGFVALDDAGVAVPDAAFGTVEKVTDSPLTVRYTLADGARWSDGTPVSPADLLLEWAARSGQFDEAVQEQPTASPPPSASGVPTPDSSVGSTARAAASAAPEPSAASAAPEPSATAADEAVRFGATSPALLAASALPTVDGRSVTLVYDRPVADWQVALDVNVPAHVVGRLALGSDEAGAAPTASATAGAAAAVPSPAATAGRPWSDDQAAAAVAGAIVGQDRAALAPIADAWRSGWTADELAADPTRAVTTGPYRIAALDPGASVELVRNDEYQGSRPAAKDRILVRWDLDPLAAIDALRDGEVDVVAPVVTPDVTAALNRVPDVRLRDGGGAVFQLVLDEASGPFAVSEYATGDGASGDAAGDADAAAGDAGGDPTGEATGAEAVDLAAAQAAQVRSTFIAAVPRADLAIAAGADPSDAVLATLGPAAATSPPVASGGVGDVPGPVPVRVLVSTGDPARAAMFESLTTAASAAGFDVTAAEPDDPSTALWNEPEAWDAALIPVTQSELPIAGTIDRWRTGGATDVTGHADAALDTLLDSLATTVDPTAVANLLDQVGAAVRDAHVVVPLARQPSVAATVDRAEDSDLPDVGEVPAVPWGLADLSAWWAWACSPSAAG